MGFCMLYESGCISFWEICFIQSTLVDLCPLDFRYILSGWKKQSVSTFHGNGCLTCIWISHKSLLGRLNLGRVFDIAIVKVLRWKELHYIGLPFFGQFRVFNLLLRKSISHTPSTIPSLITLMQTTNCMYINHATVCIFFHIKIFPIERHFPAASRKVCLHHGGGPLLLRLRPPQSCRHAFHTLAAVVQVLSSSFADTQVQD